MLYWKVNIFTFLCHSYIQREFVIWRVHDKNTLRFDGRGEILMVAFNLASNSKVHSIHSLARTNHLAQQQGMHKWFINLANPCICSFWTIFLAHLLRTLIVCLCNYFIALFFSLFFVVFLDCCNSVASQFAINNKPRPVWWNTYIHTFPGPD